MGTRALQRFEAVPKTAARYITVQPAEMYEFIGYIFKKWKRDDVRDVKMKQQKKASEKVRPLAFHDHSQVG